MSQTQLHVASPRLTFSDLNTCSFCIPGDPLGPEYHLGWGHLSRQRRKKLWGLGRMCSEPRHTLKRFLLLLPACLLVIFICLCGEPRLEALFCGFWAWEVESLPLWEHWGGHNKKGSTEPLLASPLFCQSQQRLLQWVPLGPKAAKGPFRAGWGTDPDQQHATLRSLCIELCPLKTHMLKS